MECEHCFLVVPLEMPAAVLLSQWMSVGGCGWPSSSNVNLMMRPSFTFIKSAPNSTSAADDATNFKMMQRLKIVPLIVMGYPSLGNEQRKKFPDSQHLKFFAKSWDASEWMFSTMSDAWNLIIAWGLVKR